VLESPEAQRAAMAAGLRRLLMLQLPSPLAWVRRQLDNRTKLALGHNPHGSVEALLEDCHAAAVDALVGRAGGPVWDEPAYDRLREQVRADLHDTTLEVVRTVGHVLAAAHDLRLRVDRTTTPALRPVVDDVRAQLDSLVHRGFVTVTGAERLPDLVRYLGAVEHRLERAPGALGRDLEHMERIQVLEDALDARLEAVPTGVRVPEALEEAHWLLQELRVSAFAQQLGTRVPVSEKRVRRVIAGAAQG
jgi:ATP-dependent helicase HrpA